ncbi:MAG: hypothetical protein V4735_01615 [Pseudomonadota bacterium]
MIRTAVSDTTLENKSENLEKSGSVPLADLHALNQDLNPFAHQEHEAKPKRTLGLRLFDATLYGAFFNSTVFAASTAFTYMTKYGNTVGKEASALRSVGNFFYKRRQPILNGFRKIGVKNETAADMFTTVLFSFLDGSIFAAMVKPLEDYRERIAFKIDNLLGTTADNLKAYDAEPKQTWGSVLGGRGKTSLIVLPVALIMEATGGNKKIFYNGGDKLEKLVEKFPTLNAKFTGLASKNYLFQTVVFEAFYTTVCTAGTYLFSRRIAIKHPPSLEYQQKHHMTLPPRPAADATTDIAPADAPTTDTPGTRVMQPAHMERIQTPLRMQEVTA